MSKVTAQQYAEKWGRNLKNSTQDIRAGVERVATAPGVQASKQSAKYLAGIQRAVADGTWQRNVAAVSLQDWQQKTINKGIQRISAGVDGAQQAQIQMAEKLLAAVDSVKAKVDAMPSLTLDDNLNRMVAFARGMSEKKIK